MDNAISRTKIIFLDIDGVLINKRFASKNTADPRCVAELNRITNITGAKIVISSTWKHLGIGKLTLILRQWGVTGEIIGLTPDLPNKERRCEIMYWLDSSDYGWENSMFVVIDDELEAIPAGDYGVRTSFEYGLNAIDADRAIAILELLDPRGIG